jgi:hypothetical protein
MTRSAQIQDHYNEGSVAAVVALPPLAAFFAYNASKRSEVVATLRQTRAELARIAVSDERPCQSTVPELLRLSGRECRCQSGS